MSTIKISKYLEYTLKGVLYLVLLSPLLVSSRYLFPFITTKTMYFRLLIELAIVLYVSLAMITSEFRPKMTKLSWAIVIFGIIIFITGITGVDFYKTFWGTIERGEGFLTISHLIIYFLILTWLWKSKEEWLNFLTALVGIGILIDLYAIVQRLNQEHFFLFGRIIHAGEGRLSATIGNAAFLAAFTLAQFFMSVLLFFKRKNIGWKIFGALAVLVNLYVLYETQTRGAAIALVIVLFFSCVFYTLKSPDRTKKRVAFVLLFLLIVSAVTIWFNRNSFLVQQSPMLHRLVSISKSDITTESRLSAWNTSWQGWKDRFVIGYGWENYNIAFNKYFPAIIYKDQGSQLWFDRAHNTIFDVAVATGIIGLSVYLLIFALSLYYLVKNLKYDFDTSAILISLLTAHFIQNIFVFDVLASYIILSSIIAFVVFISIKGNGLIEQHKKSEFNLLIFFLVFVIVAFGAYIFNIKPLQANKKSVDGLILMSADKVSEGIKIFKQAIDMKTYHTQELRQKLADNILIRNKLSNKLTKYEVQKNFEIAIEELKKNIAEHPKDVQNYLYLMAILNQAGVYDQVIEWGKKAIPLSPTRPQIYFEMGQASINQKKFEEGINYFKKGVLLNPQTMDSHWLLMTAYILAGQNEQADEEHRFMTEHNYGFDTLQNLNRLYNVYRVVGNYKKVAEILEKLVVIEPTGINYARLAAAYKEIGELEKAREAVQKAVALDASLAEEAEKFIEMLE